MADLASQYQALRSGVGAVELPRDVLGVSGPQAVEYLQGQLSQDVEALAPGDTTLSFLLEPQGKVVALLRVTRTGDDAFVLDTDAGYGEGVNERLRRFKLRTKVTLEALPWRCVALRGPAARDHATSVDPPGELVVPADWPGLPGIDVLGPDVGAPPEVIRADDAYEAARIEAGIPRMGAELTDRTIPEETGVVDRAVSFTKGCYTGQELVARIDSRGGNVPRRLRGVIVQVGTEGAAPARGGTLSLDGKEIGVLTSVAARPAAGTDATDAPAIESVGLAYIKRGNEPPLEAEIAWEGGTGVARIEALPLVS